MEKQVNQTRTARDTVANGSGIMEYDLFTVTKELEQELLANHQTAMNSMKQELALSEDARLRIRLKSGKYYFSSKEIATGKEEMITDDTDRVYLLARRSYLEKAIKAEENQIRVLKRLLNDSEEKACSYRIRKKLKRYADVGLDCSRIMFTKEQNEWIDEVFVSNPFKPENLKYQTKGGIKVRSKSEAAIGNSLEAIGWPYRNDDIVRITGGDYDNRPFRETYYADFKVPNLLGGITIHEHFGAFQIDNYAENGLKRLNDYHNFTVIELSGRPVSSNEFTWSFESDIQDSVSMKRLIKKLLLPGY